MLQKTVCNGCHDILLMSIDISSIVILNIQDVYYVYYRFVIILNIQDVYYRFVIFGITKSEVINLLRNTNLCEINRSL